MLQSIRARLTLWYSAMLIAILLGLSGLGHLTLSKALHRQIDHATQLEAEEIRSRLLRELGTARRLEEAVARISNYVSEEEMFVQILSPDGAVLTTSANLGDRLEAMALTSGSNSAWETVRFSGDREVRVHIAPVFETDHLLGYVQVGTSLQTVQSSTQYLRRIATISLPIALLAAIGFGWYLAAKALTPIETITMTAQDISAEDLNKRLAPVSMPQELRRLATTFNAMLDRLELSFGKQRQLIADASHQLRTPMAVIRGHVDVALSRKGSEADYRAALEIVREECRSLTAMTDAMLTLARAEAGRAQIRQERVELDSLLETVKVQGRALAGDREIILTEVHPLIIHGDGDLLHQALLNLLDNAIRHTPSGGRIEVFLREEAGWACLGVKDHGEGISTADLPRVFDRFYRGKRVRDDTPGAGLGLGIASEIIKAHKGRIEVLSEPGEGSLFVIRLPLQGYLTNI